MFHIFSIYDCHLFLRKLNNKNNDKVNVYVIPQTNEAFISVAYVCKNFGDSYRFLSMSLDGLFEN